MVVGLDVDVCMTARLMGRIHMLRVIVCCNCRWQVNVGLTTYRGPGQDDPSLGPRFGEEGYADDFGYEEEDDHEQDDEYDDEDEDNKDEEGPAKLTSVLGKRVREERDEDADQD